MCPTRLSEFLLSVLSHLSPVCVCLMKTADTGSRPGYDDLLRDAGPTPGGCRENIPHLRHGSHQLRSSHYRPAEALLSVSDLAAPLADGWWQFKLVLLPTFLS